MPLLLRQLLRLRGLRLWGLRLRLGGLRLGGLRLRRRLVRLAGALARRPHAAVVRVRVVGVVVGVVVRRRAVGVAPAAGALARRAAHLARLAGVLPLGRRHVLVLRGGGRRRRRWAGRRLRGPRHGREQILFVAVLQVDARLVRGRVLYFAGQFRCFGLSISAITFRLTFRAQRLIPTK